MANKVLEISVILSAMDRMSTVVNSSVTKSQAALSRFQQSTDRFAARTQQIGTQSLMMGAATGAMLAAPIKAYADLEDASTRLASTMMRDGGEVSKNFDAINNIAIELGNKLPGTTADFQNMMTMLIRNGIQEESILQGVGKSAAYLAVGLKLPFEDAARMAAKLKEATGVADEQFIDFMDTIARTNQLGVESSEMQYAFSRSAGALKLMGLQGLEASKSVSVLYAELIKTGATGETVGTGMTSMFNAFLDDKKMAKFNAEAAKFGMSFRFTDAKTGQFLGVENMVAQLDKLQKLNPTQRAGVVQALLGPGQDANFMNVLIEKGISGYNGMVDRMAKQGTLQAKVNKQLGTLTNLWEAATGTFTNAQAAFGEVLSPELKSLTIWMNEASESMQRWIKENQTAAKVIGITIGVITGLLVAVGTVSLLLSAGARAVSAFISVWNALGSVFNFLVGTFKFVGQAVLWLSRIMMANPIIAIITAIAVAAYLIYTYWDDIAAFFKRMWDIIVPYFQSAWESIKKVFMGAVYYIKMLLWDWTPMALIIKHWDVLAPYFNQAWATVKQTFWDAVAFVKMIFWDWTPMALIIKHWDVLAPFFKKIWTDVMDFISTIPDKFMAAGENIMNSLFEGMKKMANKPIEAMKDTVSKMREYLPFSPAKTGPFKDLHRVKIVETIADSMNPAPLVRSMRTVAVAGMTAIAPLGNVQAAQSLPRPATPASSSAAVNQSTSAPITINYNPTIHIAGGSETDIKALLNKHKEEIARLVEEVHRRNNRRSFS